MQSIYNVYNSSIFFPQWDFSLPNITAWTRMSLRKQLLHLETDHVQVQVSNFEADRNYGHECGALQEQGISWIRKAADQVHQRCARTTLHSTAVISAQTSADGTEQSRPHLQGCQEPAEPWCHLRSSVTKRLSPPFPELEQKCSKSNPSSAPCAGSTQWNTLRS